MTIVQSHICLVRCLLFVPTFLHLLIFVILAEKIKGYPFLMKCRSGEFRTWNGPVPCHLRLLHLPSQRPDFLARDFLSQQHNHHKPFILCSSHFSRVPVQYVENNKALLKHHKLKDGGLLLAEISRHYISSVHHIHFGLQLSILHIDPEASQSIQCRQHQSRSSFTGEMAKE